MAESDNEKGNGAPSSKSTSEQFTESLREAGQKAADLARNPVARNMFAAGLVTAAAALTANKKFRGNVEKAGKNAQDAAANTADNASKIGAAIIGAATDAVRKLLGNDGEETLASKPARKPAAKKSTKPAAKKTGKAAPKAAASRSKAKAADGAATTTAAKAKPKAAAAKRKASSDTPKAAPRSRAKKAAPAAAQSDGGGGE